MMWLQPTAYSLQIALEKCAVYFTCSFFNHSFFFPKCIVPLIRIPKILQYLPVASALLLGGLTVTTVTLNQGSAFN